MILTLLRIVGYVMFLLLIWQLMRPKEEKNSGFLSFFVPITTEEYVKRYGNKRPF